MKDLARLAIDEAMRRGATYADARILRSRRQELRAEDRRLGGFTDAEDVGIGVRVLAGGAWGFAGSHELTRDEALRVAAEAVAVARASARCARREVVLAPEAARTGSFASDVRIDPFAVDPADKAGLLLELTAGLLANPGVRRATAWMTLRRAERLFLSSEGHDLQSDVTTTGCSYTATAVGGGDARSRTFEVPPRTLGYENLDRARLLGEVERVAAQAVEHLSAPSCPEGRLDLVLDPHNLALTIHESVGHATELDRVLGYEESLAGRSFATPDFLGGAYGSPEVTFVADNTLPGGLATHGFDDEGVEGQRWHIVREGVFEGYGTGREVAAELGMERSNGTCRADHWSSIPIVRIPNLSLMPGKRPLSPEELIADTKDGIYIEGRGSFSIDQMRVNFQFGGDAAWRIKNGKLDGMLKNVTYQSMTTEFWGSCDAVCDERHWVPNGVLQCGKGDPVQISQMTHGAATARFRDVMVGGAVGGMKPSTGVV
ncbi:MAG: TldD/PmbA family protein [Myxococcales bacterium]|nr:TldD/PmbA family protein [Myxococcales bacterium]